jgi:ketosteroid isomerase-like protein
MGRSADIESAVSAFVEEVNSGKIDAALARFTHDATIVEDIAPYKWRGPEAGAEWLTAMAANAERLAVADVVMDLGAAQRIEVEGSAGYAVFAGTVLLRKADQTLREAGLLTFAFERHLDHWLIAALTWTGERPKDR